MQEVQVLLDGGPRLRRAGVEGFRGGAESARDLDPEPAGGLVAEPAAHVELVGHAPRSRESHVLGKRRVSAERDEIEIGADRLGGGRLRGHREHADQRRGEPEETMGNGREPQWGSAASAR